MKTGIMVGPTIIGIVVLMTIGIEEKTRIGTVVLMTTGTVTWVIVMDVVKSLY
jgi:hypothetical protein